MERFSKNRQAIVQCLRSTPIHPTAEWVYAQLRPQYPSLSIGTVYRNLCQLKESGVIRSLGVVAGQEHFDGNTAPHAHVLCTRCGRIDDLPLTPPLTAALDAASSAGFAVQTIQFTGLCPACAQENAVAPPPQGEQ